jgi:hypothetical protein
MSDTSFKADSRSVRPSHATVYGEEQSNAQSVAERLQPPDEGVTNVYLTSPPFGYMLLTTYRLFS